MLAPTTAPPKILPRAAARKQGLKLCFTGKACKRGHISQRYVLSGNCVQCDRNADRLEKKALWREKNKEQIADKGREYRFKNRAKASTYQRTYLTKLKAAAQVLKELGITIGGAK